MALHRWKKLRRQFEIKNPWWTYRKDITQLPNGNEGEYHFVHVKGSSMIIPVLENQRMLMVNQYRYLADKESLEFPCGSVKENSTFEETALHELAEETSFHASDLKCVAEFNPYNGVTDEICKVFLAQGLTPVDANHDETEEFEQVQLSMSDLQQKIDAGEIWDGMTLAAWVLVKNRLPI